MKKIDSEISMTGWRFDNTYARLPKIMLSQLSPVPVKIPKVVVLNHKLSKELGLNFSDLNKIIQSLYIFSCHFC